METPSYAGLSFGCKEMVAKCMLQIIRKGLLVASSTGGQDVITVIRAIWVKPGKSGKQGYLGNMSSK